MSEDRKGRGGRCVKKTENRRKKNDGKKDIDERKERRGHWELRRSSERKKERTYLYDQDI